MNAVRPPETKIRKYSPLAISAPPPTTLNHSHPLEENIAAIHSIMFWRKALGRGKVMNKSCPPQPSALPLH